MKLRALLVFVTLGTVAPAAAAEDAGVNVGSAAGIATRFHRGLPWRAVEHPRALRFGEQLRCEHGCDVRFDDGTAATLAPGAVVRAGSPVFRRFASSGSAVRCLTLHLVEGTVQIGRPDRPERPLLVTTTSGAELALHEGTSRFRALAHRTAAALLDGRLELDRGIGWHTLEAGRSHRIERSGFVSAAPLVTAPRWEEGGADHRSIGLAVYGPQGQIGGSWEPVDGATVYDVRVTGDGGTLVTSARVDAREHRFTARLPEGRYEVTVRATDADGLESELSAPRTMRVVRAALPPGGFMPQPATLVVPEGGRLRFLDAADLEVSIDDHGFHKAPAELPPPARARQKLALRVAGMPDTATVVDMERRALHARVTLTPRLPVWPDDQLAAVVELIDPSGQMDPSGVTPSLELRIAGAPTPARWEKSGAVWRTVIARRDLGGPALVDVVVRDDDGLWLGWGFVEVVGTARTAVR
jgi:hypothetical protein